MQAAKKIILSVGLLLSMVLFFVLQRGLKKVAFPATSDQLIMVVSNDCPYNIYSLSFAESVSGRAEHRLATTRIGQADNFQEVIFTIPSNFQPGRLRLELGQCATAIKLKQLRYGAVTWDADRIYENFRPNECVVRYERMGDYVLIESRQNYPSLTSTENAPVGELAFHQATFKPYWYALLLSALFFAIWHFIFFVRFDRRPVETTGFSPRIYFGVLFLLLLFTPLLILKPLEDGKSGKEKRVRRGFSRIKVPTILNYTGELSGFLNDNFGGRDLIIGGYADIMTGIFSTSPNRDKVEIGRNGRLFYSGEDLFEQTENRHPLTMEQLKKMRKTLVERQQWLKLRGIDFYLMIPHITQNVYREDLPASFTRTGNISKREQLLRFLESSTDIKLIVLDTVMQEAKKYGQLYLLYDTHWNCLAGYAAYRKIMHEMGKTHKLGKPLAPLDLEFNWVDRGQGDCQSMMGITYRNNNTMADIIPKKRGIVQVEDTSETARRFAPYGQPTYILHDKNTADTTAPRLLVYRDSYAGFFTRYLSTHFSNSTLIWNRFFDPEEVAYARPDIVLHEIVERILFNLEMGNRSRIEEELKAHGIVIDDAYFDSRINRQDKLPGHLMR